MNHLFKSFTSVLLGAAALATLATGCVREQFSTNPNYDPDKNTVLTKFVLNINPQTGEGTKMTPENVQASGTTFLGMQDVHILTYKMDEHNTPSFDGAPATTGAGAAVGKFFFNPYYAGKATEDYNFGRLLDAGTVTDTKQSRVMELSFPLETNVVVLYGKALNTKGPDHQGSITATGDPSNLASLRFSLAPRVDPSNKFPYTAGTYALQGVISSLIIAGLVDETKYWTTDGAKKSGNNNFQPTGISNKQYKIWLPYEPNDALYKKISGANTGGEGIFTDPAGNDYGENATYERRGDDPVSTHTYKLKIGNCSWKMLGDMYAAEHDGDSNTSADVVCNACDGNGLSFVPLLGSLGEAYYKLLKIASLTDEVTGQTYHELRAGSAAAILRTLRDLDFILHKVLDATPANWGEVIAQQLAKEIHTRMKLYFDGDKDNMVYRSAADIKTALYNNVKDVPAALALYNDSGIATYFTNDYLRGTGNALDGTDGFPMNIGFPMGAAYLEADVKAPEGSEYYYFHAERFVFSEEIPAYAFGSNSTFNIFNYCYPAELMYYGNSPLRVSETAHAELEFPQTVALWKDDTKWGTDWIKFGNVKSSTRSVAMVDCINYGSALLKAPVVYDNAVTELLDNNSAIHKGESDNHIPINDETNGLLVTGIVIGGQPAAVTWDFTRMPDSTIDNKNTDDTSDDVVVPPSYQTAIFEDGVFKNLSFTQDKFEKMIYDKVADTDRFRIKKESDTNLETGENTVYTLCWDNYDALKTAAEQPNVYMALELQNKTGMDFWGETNLVRKDAIFYLVGKLDLDKLRTNSSGNYGTLNGHLGDRSKTGYYYYPPFDPTTGATVEVPRVFMQDYVTTAKLVLKQDALKHAYMSVPDLRSNQVSLGVSVDIKWETGLSFEVEMGKLN